MTFFRSCGLFSLFAAICLSAACVARMGATKPESGAAVRSKVALLEFRGIGGDEGVNSELRDWSGYFAAVLSKVPSVELMERSSLEKILQEQKFQQSGLVDHRTAVDIGQLSGADYVIAGTCVKDHDQLRVYLKLMDSASGSVLLARSTETTAQGLDRAKEYMAARIAEELDGAISAFHKKLLRASSAKGGMSPDLMSRAYGSYEAGDYYEGIRLLKDSLSSNPSAAGYAQLGELYRRVDDPARAMVSYERAISLYSAAGDKREESKSLLELGTVLMDQGKLALAREYFNKALNLASGLGDAQIEAGAYGDMGVTYILEDDFKTAERWLLAAKKAADRVGLPDLKASIDSNMSLLYLSWGDYEKAISVTLEGLGEFKKAGNFKNAETAYLELGDCYNYLGDHAAALKYLREGILYSMSDPGKGAAAAKLQWRAGSTCLALGKEAAAFEYLGNGVTSLEKYNDWPALASAAWETADFLRKRGSYVEAAVYQDKSIAAIEKTGMKNLQARNIYYTGAWLSIKSGLIEKAKDLLERVVGLDELNAAPELELHRELLETLRSNGRPGGVKSGFEDLATLFRPRIAILDIPVTGRGHITPSLTALSDKLGAELLNHRDVVVVERTRLAPILAELKYGQSGAIDPGTAAKVGKLLGASILVVGASHAMGSKAEITVRVIEVSTGKVLGGILERDVSGDNLAGKTRGVAARILEILRFNSMV